jgi:hypothetical protein
MSSTPTLSRHRQNESQNARNVPYATVDQRITEELERLTAIDSMVWTAPDYDRRSFVHSFFQYPAMMVPIVQKHLIATIKKYNLNTHNMIDPFMGSSTSIIASMYCGLSCTGQDINPLAVLLSKVKCGPYTHRAFAKRATILMERIDNDPSRKLEISFENWRKWFRMDVAIQLSRIVRAIRKEPSIHARRLFWITLAEVVRLSSNDRTSTFKLHCRPLEEIGERELAPVETFRNALGHNIQDIEQHRKSLQDAGQQVRRGYGQRVDLKLKDSSAEIFRPGNSSSFQYDLLVSSSPYGDNHTTVTYGQHAYLALQWIDLRDIDQDVDPTCLRTTAEIDRRSLGGRAPELDQIELTELYAACPTLKEVVTELSARYADRTPKVISFVNDFRRSIKLAMDSLRPDAYLVWTMGNRNVGGIEIRNDEILIDLMRHNNATLVTRLKRDILNKRMAYKNSSSKTMACEDILVFRKRG